MVSSGSGARRPGIPKAGQLQLAQPLLTLVSSVLLLGEHRTRPPR
ncbi:hypothetical protein GCM10018787_43360 [Streptomyces thermodiastaticus]|jgi:hypothetical protein|nr:hypothetical protein GCM10018787_43360 [Streptomyces thermodiastaticus]